MFEFLKRWTSPAPAPAAQRSRSPTKRKSSSSKGPIVSAPGPLPEVVEGNQESDWALWEDSKNALDSQMQGLPRSSGYGKPGGTSQFDTLPSELGGAPDSLYGDLDAFGSVRKRDR
jgi:hypothetical protein